MNLYIIRIINFLKTLKSLFFLNFYFFCIKIIRKNYKIIFFYFPIKSYQENLIELIKEISSEKNLKVFLGFNLGSSKEVKHYKNSFFINLGYLKYLYNLNMFISSYIVYTLPKTKNKIYINHDIYDAPMVSKENESNLVESLKKYDFIFMSSDITLNMLRDKFNQIDLTETLKKPKIINAGYLKLDHVHKKIDENKKLEDSILIAPTKSSVFLEHDMSQYLEEVINKILNYKGYKIIYRPHPGDLKDKTQLEKILKINELFESNKNFVFDTSTSYLESYKRAKFMITDFSGTAYTYAFCKLNPVIFFSKNEKKLLKGNLSKLYYFKDRSQVGIIENDINNLNNSINVLEENIHDFKAKIKVLRGNRIEHFNNSMQEHLKNLFKILNNEEKN